MAACGCFTSKVGRAAACACARAEPERGAHMHRTRKISVWMTVALIVSTLTFPTQIGFAQSSKGVLVGTVTDPTGAVISGATVKATNKSTGVSRDTVSGAGGDYRL